MNKTLDSMGQTDLRLRRDLSTYVIVSHYSPFSASLYLQSLEVSPEVLRTGQLAAN